MPLFPKRSIGTTTMLPNEKHKNKDAVEWTIDTESGAAMGIKEVESVIIKNNENDPVEKWMRKFLEDKKNRNL